jgi:hypothetical protein
MNIGLEDNYLSVGIHLSTNLQQIRVFLFLSFDIQSPCVGPGVEFLPAYSISAHSQRQRVCLVRVHVEQSSRTSGIVWSHLRSHCQGAQDWTAWPLNCTAGVSYVAGSWQDFEPTPRAGVDDEMIKTSAHGVFEPEPVPQIQLLGSSSSLSESRHRYGLEASQPLFIPVFLPDSATTETVVFHAECYERRETGLIVSQPSVSDGNGSVMMR